VLLVGLVGCQVLHPPHLEYARTLGAVDAALVQQWSAIPKPVQEQLASTYSRLGLVPPSQRK
jgi:hypothetical protein